ncbi:MAG: flippase-like domain-containing protein, partial [Chloroflexi bacterium]|nr:flippase-like domain-containing protein [Chloroflexota bacterium]
LPSSMGGDAVKAYYMGQESGNGAGSASAVLLSRVTGFLGMLLMALPTIFFFEDRFKDTVVVEFLLTCGLVLSGICGALVVANYLPKISAKFLKRSWTKHKLFLTLLKVGTTLSKSARKPRSMGGAILFGSMFWVTTCLNYYVYGAALGLHIPLYFYLIAIPFASTISSLPISINGFGVRESLFLYLFSKVQVPPASALLLALLMDAQRIVFGVIGGCIYFAMSGAIKKAQEAEAEKQ